MTRSALPLLPVSSDGSLPPLALLRQWLRLARDAGSVVALERIPYGNSIIPQLAEWGDFDQIRMHRPDLPRSFPWQCGSACIQVDNPPGHGEGIAQPFQGELPPCPAQATIPQQRERLIRRLEAVRLVDAASILDQSLEVDWRPALAALDSSSGNAPPLRTRSNVHETGPMRVWNPLPLRRRCVIALPPDAGPAPWAVRDHHGRCHPLQVVEGALGEEWLCEMELGPLEVVDLVPHDDPVDSEHWHMTTTCLDNGVVRAELNAQGEITRLSVLGHFLQHSQPLVCATIDGIPLHKKPEIRVLEHGPCRGRLSISHEHEHGYLRIMYTLHAHEALLHCTVIWTQHGDTSSEVRIHHPLAWPQPILTCCGEAIPWRCERSRHPGQATAQQHGLRWIHAQQGHQHCALVSRRSISVAPDTLALSVIDSANYVLYVGPSAAGLNEDSGNSLSTLSLINAVPGRHAGAAPISPPLFHSDHSQGIVMYWVGRPQGWHAEIMAQEHAGVSGTFTVYPRASVTDVRLVDADGRVRHDCVTNKDGDGWIIPFQPYDMLIIRMR
ncbi:MAG: hypothetical protein EA401_12380 [Planctomycetota bacterium]|nr:MAG: hypothetical protein EA401_12380 [Planctomycetota bacterium]